MRTQKKEPTGADHNPQASYYQHLLTAERKKRKFILHWVKKNHPKIFIDLSSAIDNEIDRRYKVTLKAFGLSDLTGKL